MNLVIFGIQGSGKGTQAKIMTDRYHLANFETGAELRRLAKEDSPLGKKIKKFTESGKLVPAEVIMQILDNFLSHAPHRQRIIFDGIPRNQKQQKAFDRIMRKWKRKFLAINITIPEEETVKRLLLRARHDDTPEVIRTRIKIFQKNTSPVIEKYRKNREVIDINGNQSIKKVAAEIAKKLDKDFLPR